MSSVSTRMQSSDYMGTEKVGKLLLRFSVPSIIAMLVMSLYNIVDQLFIGHGIGYLGNAATNIVFPINVLTIALSMLMGEGASALYSIRLGEGQREEARRCVGNAIVMLSAVGLSFAVVCLLFLQPLLGFFGATEAIMPYAIDYAAPIVFGIPFLVVGPGMNAIIRANGAPSFAMKAMVTGAVLNTILDPIFIFTLGMGVKGAAIATAISQFASFLLSASYFIGRESLGLRREHFRPHAGMLGKIAACGLSSCISQMAVMVVIVLMNKTLVFQGALSPYGAEIPLAAHGITMKVNQIMFSILIGLAVGSQPIIGYNFGAGKYERVKRTLFLSVSAATCAGTAAFIMFFFFPQTLIGLFGQENELYNEFARKCFRIFLFCTVLNGFTVLAGGFFQAMARVRWAAAIQLSRQIGFMIPAVLLLSHYWGLDGVLFAGPLTDGLSFLLALGLVVREFRRLDRKAAARRHDEAALSLPLPEAGGEEIRSA